MLSSFDYGEISNTYYIIYKGKVPCSKFGSNILTKKKNPIDRPIVCMTPIRYIGLIPLTYLQRPAIGNLCVKFYQDSSKTARIVYIETNGQANGQANGRTYERTDRRTDRQTWLARFPC